MRKIKSSRQPEILQAAMEIADTQGLDALSMRAVATRIGVTPMTLYGYFRDKTALLDGLVGAVLAELPQPDPAADWRDRLTRIAYDTRDLAHRHPGVFPLLLLRPAVTPDALRVVETLFQALLDAGVPRGEVARLERMLSTFVLGFAASETGGRFSGTAPSPKERREAGTELPAHHLLGGELDAPVDWEAEFAADLAALLRMIETVAARG